MKPKIEVKLPVDSAPFVSKSEYVYRTLREAILHGLLDPGTMLNQAEIAEKFRISRMPVPAVHDATYRFEIGKATRIREGSDVTLVACGTLVWRALAAADQLAARGVSARVLNMATIRPIDREAIVAAATETDAIVTAEEHTVYGGLGSAVAEVVVATCPVPMRILGIPGVFSPTGSTEFLFEHFGLTADAIAAAALELVGRSPRPGQ